MGSGTDRSLELRLGLAEGRGMGKFSIRGLLDFVSAAEMSRFPLMEQAVPLPGLAAGLPGICGLVTGIREGIASIPAGASRAFDLDAHVCVGPIKCITKTGKACNLKFGSIGKNLESQIAKMSDVRTHLRHRQVQESLYYGATAMTSVLQCPHIGSVGAEDRSPDRPGRAGQASSAEQHRHSFSCL